MTKKITFITYQSSTEFIVTTPELEFQTIDTYFSDRWDRKIEDYDREEHTGEAVAIEPSLSVRWG